MGAHLSPCACRSRLPSSGIYVASRSHGITEQLVEKLECSFQGLPKVTIPWQLKLGILAYITGCVAVPNFRSKQARHVSFSFSLLFRTKIIMSDASNQHRSSSSTQTPTDGFLMIQQMIQTPPRGAYTSLMRCNGEMLWSHLRTCIEC